MADPPGQGKPPYYSCIEHYVKIYYSPKFAQLSVQKRINSLELYLDMIKMHRHLLSHEREKNLVKTIATNFNHTLEVLMFSEEQRFPITQLLGALDSRGQSQPEQYIDSLEQLLNDLKASHHAYFSSSSS